MSRFEEGVLIPETVSQWINFKGRKDSNWTYQADDRESMAAKQTEGVAYLWNLLVAGKVALLADEVGMGKTFQALGVAAWLWKNKPDAKVLVMAPNRHLCGHWRREFEGFIREHIRQADDRVKTEDGMPVATVCECYQLEHLVQSVQNNEGQLYLTTVYALSGLLGPERRAEGPEGAGSIAANCHHRLKQHLGPSGFDLIIVDEAHYLRNVSGGSQRVSAAKALFGNADSRLGVWNLLLTATPSHTRLDDVQNILGYFTQLDRDPALEAMSGAERTRQLLQRYALRASAVDGGTGRFVRQAALPPRKSRTCELRWASGCRDVFCSVSEAAGGRPGPAEGEQESHLWLPGRVRVVWLETADRFWCRCGLSGCGRRPDGGGFLKGYRYRAVARPYLSLSRPALTPSRITPSTA
jgi:hypothetical protein